MWRRLMKRTWNKLLRGEKGQALIIVLILMLVGGLIITPVLAYVGTGLKIGKDVHEERMLELYAADAGVEDGLWHLQDIERLKVLVQQLDENGYVPPDGWVPADYADWPLPTYNLVDNINGKNVEVTMDYLADDKAFKITSVATSDDSSTTIDAYASGLDFGDLLQNVITSINDMNLKGTTDPPEGEEHGPVANYDGDWPPADLLSEIYLSQVEDDPSHVEFIGDTEIKFTGTENIGPLYVDGNLSLRSKQDGSTLTLNGTVYVTGTLTTDQNKTFTLDFNNQTIFVENALSYPPGTVRIGSNKTSVAGSGCLIAVGGIDFQPNVAQGDPEDFLFVMSIDDKIFAHPQGNFNGSFAGNVEVELQPGSEITWNDPSDNNLNFPWGGYMGGKFFTQIRTWEISLQ
jgi:hypothetical protein